MDFNYFFLKKSIIKSIRVYEYKDNYILTIYFYYRSYYFTKEKEKSNEKPDLLYELIFENSEDHLKELHKKDDPFDWHVHIKLEKDKIVEYLKILRKKIKISNDDYKNIINLLKGKKINNVEYEGLQDNKKLEEFKNILKKERFIYYLLKEDINKYPYIGLAFYLLRFNKLKFYINHKVIELLKTDNLNILFKFRNENINIAFNDFKELILNAYNNFEKRKNKKINLREYLNYRLTLELSWSIYQASVRQDEISLYKAYFLFTHNFQNCFNVKNCNHEINIYNSSFKNIIKKSIEQIDITDNKFNDTLDWKNDKLFN